MKENDTYDHYNSNKKKKDQGKPEDTFSLCLKVGGNVIVMATKDQGVQQFIYSLLDQMGDWRQDQYTDIIEVRFHEHDLLRFGALDDDIYYCKAWTDVENEDVRIMLLNIFRQIRPKLSDVELKDCINRCITSIAKNKSYHSMNEIFTRFLSANENEIGKKAFDKYFNCIEFDNNDEKYREYYKILLSHFCVGVMHNLFVQDLEYYVLNKEERSPFFKEEVVNRVRTNTLQSHMPLFNCILVLCGDQGLGKSYMLNCLLPTELRSYVREGSSLIPQTDLILHTQAHTLKGAILLNLEDINFKQIKKMHIYMKSQLEKKEWQYRYLWENKSRVVRRHFTPVASTNETQIIHDATGNRRLIPLWITSFNREVMNSVSREAMWAYFFRQWIDNVENITNWDKEDARAEAFRQISSMHYGSEWGSFLYKLFSTISAYKASEQDVKNTERAINCAANRLQLYAYFNARQPFYCLPLQEITNIFGDGTESINSVSRRIKDNGFQTIKKRMTVFSKGSTNNKVSAVFVEKTNAITKRLEGYIGKEYNKGSFFCFSSLNVDEMVTFTAKVEGLDDDTARELKTTWQSAYQQSDGERKAPTQDQVQQEAPF